MIRTTTSLHGSIYLYNIFNAFNMYFTDKQPATRFKVYIQLKKASTLKR